MRFAFLSLLSLAAAFAQDLENFHVEVTASLWVRNASGTIQSGLLPVDLEMDLGIDQDRPQFAGTLVLKPARRHRLILEGTPYRMTGDQVVSRQITFAGRTYAFQDRVISEATIDYIFGGYQFDFLSRPQGHWGVQAGVAYAHAEGTLTDAARGFTGTETQSFPFPLVGTEFRALRRFVSLRGEVKGMSLGSWGHYVQGGGSAGVSLGKHVTLEAGYRVVDADIHRQDQVRGFTPRFTGPVFSVQFRD